MTTRILLADAVKNPALLAVLNNLNIGETGKFHSWIQNPEWYAPIEVLLNDERDAVAMIFPCPELLFGVFVAPHARRKGKATRLWNEAVSIFGNKFWSQPFDNAGEEFFRSMARKRP